jgi:Cu2+-exporting ATPase/Cu+-exporting ATPase
MDVPRAIELSRAVIRNIKQDLFWALFYNSLGIPLAAGVFFPILGWQLSPMFGAAAMSLSSLFVVGNALRLRGFRASE